MTSDGLITEGWLCSLEACFTVNKHHVRLTACVSVKAIRVFNMNDIMVIHNNLAKVHVSLQIGTMNNL